MLTFYVISVELIALLHGAEARILPDSPRPGGVHGGIGTPSVRKHARQLIRGCVRVRLGVDGLDVKTLWCAPDEVLWVLSLELFLGQFDPFGIKLHLLAVWRGGVELAGEGCEGC